MAFISETLQMRRLTESGINIKTTYIVDGTLRYRSTDGTCQDDVHSGIRCRKEYFRQGKLLRVSRRAGKFRRVFLLCLRRLFARVGTPEKNFLAGSG